MLMNRPNPNEAFPNPKISSLCFIKMGHRENWGKFWSLVKWWFIIDQKPINSNLANRNKYEIPIHCQLRLYEGLPGTKFAHTGLSEGAFWNAPPRNLKMAPKRFVEDAEGMFFGEKVCYIKPFCISLQRNVIAVKFIAIKLYEEILW